MILVKFANVVDHPYGEWHGLHLTLISHTVSREEKAFTPALKKSDYLFTESLSSLER
jgi:hypothetical protein